MLVRVDDVTNVETQSNHSKLCIFISSRKKVKDTITLFRKFIFHKINKKFEKKTSGKMFCTFAGMTSLASNSKLCNFVTSLKLVKTPQNFVQGSFSIKLMKICHEKVKFWSQVPFKINRKSTTAISLTSLSFHHLESFN